MKNLFGKMPRGGYQVVSTGTLTREHIEDAMKTATENGLREIPAMLPVDVADALGLKEGDQHPFGPRLIIVGKKKKR